MLATLVLASLVIREPVQLERPTSRRDGTTITVSPRGPVLQIPSSWLEPGSALHLTRRQLAAVELGAGEWDTEYADVVNAALSFHDCAFAGGDDGWGAAGVSYGDLQMRLYLVHDSVDAIEARIDATGVRARKFRAFRNVTGPWRKRELSFGLRYGDYGGTAHVEYRLRAHGSTTVVVVFMYAVDHAQQIAAILDSIRWRD